MAEPQTGGAAEDDPFATTFSDAAQSVRHEESKEDLIAEVRVGRFQIVRRLGGGGFGTVYLARDSDMDRLVALKFPNGKLLATSRARDEFQREARCTAKLRHERIVTVFDFGQHSDGRWFIIYEYISGTNLAEVLQKRRISPSKIALILAQVADALHYAHEQGLVHRDIKPANILLDEQERPYVADFGLAILGEESISDDSRISGTPAYMSPEQIRGEGHRIDSRTDIYSLGVVLYQSLCGRRPFEGSNIRELAAQIGEREPRPLRLSIQTCRVSSNVFVLKQCPSGLETATQLRQIWLKSCDVRPRTFRHNRKQPRRNSFPNDLHHRPVRHRLDRPRHSSQRQVAWSPATWNRIPVDPNRRLWIPVAR